jgi:hypothetical protein
MKVLITAPLRQSVDIFQAYQGALDKLTVPHDRFYVVNDCPEIIPYIRGDYEVMNTGDLYQKTSDDHIWTHDNLTKMHALRNRTVKAMLDGGYDYWFSVDTDVILHPLTLETLIAADKDIVSEIFWTNGWCNAWMYDQAAGMSQEWKKPGLYQVGMTGACTLVKRKVFEAGVDYTPIPCIVKSLWGEDRHFSIRAACAGFEMWVDTHYPAEHLFTAALYKDWRNRHDNAG